MIDALDGVPLTHERVALRASGVDGPLHLHMVTAGPVHGAPVILLHGFPDAWVGWSKQIPVLARAGYRVIVPDQRGFGPSDKPRGHGAYFMRHLVDDIVALQDALCGGAPTHVVGHDWGGGVAWGLAATRPERVRTLTILNCPRPEVMKRFALRHPSQVLRSTYMIWFQIPWLSERQLAAGTLVREVRRWHKRAPHTDAEWAELTANWSSPDTVRPMLNWYRAAFRDRAIDARVTVPTVMVWGTRDDALDETMGPLSLATCDDAKLVIADDAGHFVQRARPDVVNPAILDHLAAHGGPDPLVYKIVRDDVWAAAADPWPGSPDDQRDGFVHLSSAAQVDGTLAKHFAGQTGLIVLAVDPRLLPPGALKWEVSRDGKRFPHLYAPLPKAAALSFTRR